jgi:hypothetical protein
MAGWFAYIAKPQAVYLMAKAQAGLLQIAN